MSSAIKTSLLHLVGVEQHPTNWTHNPQLHTRPTTCKPKRQVPQAATICITLELLMMGIMVPETRWANDEFCNKNQSVASNWPFIFHVLTTMHDQTHIKLLLLLLFLFLWQRWWRSYHHHSGIPVEFRGVLSHLSCFHSGDTSTPWFITHLAPPGGTYSLRNAVVMLKCNSASHHVKSGDCGTWNYLISGLHPPSRSPISTHPFGNLMCFCSKVGKYLLR